MELPVSSLLKFTIPQATPYRTEQIVCSENIALCPYLFICWQLSHAIWSSHRFPPTHPFRSLVYTLCQLLSCSSWLYNKKIAPKNWADACTAQGIFMSVFWISTIAWELLNCLAALLGLMVLEWPWLAALLGLEQLCSYKHLVFIQMLMNSISMWELWLLLSSYYWGSLLGITWCRFWAPRFWRFCCVGLYILFTAVSLVISKFSVWFVRCIDP